MASIEYKYFPDMGKGFSIKTQMIPPAGLIAIIRSASEGSRNLLRLSIDGGESFSNWELVSEETFPGLGKMYEQKDLVIDYINEPLYQPMGRGVTINSTPPNLNKVYDKSIFKLFFNSNDPATLTWAVNVLEKIFEPGILPLYVSRQNEEDFSTFFLTVTHLFSFIVIYSRQFRQIENSDLLMKEFIEGWGVIYENINTLPQRRFLFNNWVDEFRKRGTLNVAETGGEIEGEVRRIVGYQKPNEFIFAVLAPQNIGWCLGWSSPTWYGTETVNSVSKGWDYGADYVGDNYSGLVSFQHNILDLPAAGGTEVNEIYTNNPWALFIDENVSSDFAAAYSAGVGRVVDYPTIGQLNRRFDEDRYAFLLEGSGRVGITTEIDKSKVIEVYPGLDYEVTVWVKALSTQPQNIEFGVHCYDGNMQLINQIRITDWITTNSFYTGDRYQSPCKVPGVYYRLRGVIYNVMSDKEEEFYLNFENGRPLRFMGDVKYMAPYVVQDRTGAVSDILIAGVCLKPLDLPFSQGFLGQKNLIAMYAQIKTARTRPDVEDFIQKYLVSYKNIVSHTWLDWVLNQSWFLTFYVTREVDGAPIEGAVIEMSNGFIATTDINGFTRFELPMDYEASWVITARGVEQEGSIFMDRDRTINSVMNLPLYVDYAIIPEFSGSAETIGSRLPYTSISMVATPTTGYEFIRWEIITDSTVDVRNPSPYFLTRHDIRVNAIFELSSELVITPSKVTLPPQGGSYSAMVTSTKKWAFDPIGAPWVSIAPTKGDAGDTDIDIEI